MDLIDEYLALLKSLDNLLSKDELRNIQSKSMTNFLISFKKIKGEDVKQKILKCFEEYFQLIKSYDYRIDYEMHKEINLKYIMKIGQYYNYQLGFKPIMRFSTALFFGVVFDVFLLSTGFLKTIYYVPISSLLVLVQNRYIEFFYKRKNKCYGFNY